MKIFRIIFLVIMKLFVKTSNNNNEELIGIKDTKYLLLIKLIRLNFFGLIMLTIN